MENATVEQLWKQDGSHAELMQTFASSVFDLTWEYLSNNHSSNRTARVLQLLSPDQIRQEVDFSIPQKGENLTNLIEYCKKALSLGVANNHARFFNQLYSSPNPVSLLGEWVSTVVNANVHTYEVAPFFIVVEQEVLEYMRGLVGFPIKDGDGIFVPGGSISNLYGLLIARNKAAPHIKTEGFRGDENLVFFTSEESHYSLKRAANLIGLGTSACISVECDEFGRMKVNVLREKILAELQKGKKPFFVNSTSGTTVLGTFDPLEQIADVCEKYGLWMHVDAALGGNALLSEEHRVKLKGCSRADSFIWNPHKTMGIPLQCSVFLTRHKDVLHDSFASNATYLFQAEKLYSQFDIGDKTIQCGRKPDAFKAWLSLKCLGRDGYSALVSKQYSNADYLRQKISKEENFFLVVNSPESLNVCFWYVPSTLLGSIQKKGLETLEVGTEGGDALHRVTEEIKLEMRRRGKTLVAYQPWGRKPNFFKICMSSTVCTTEDLDFVLEEIKEISRGLYGEK